MPIIQLQVIQLSIFSVLSLFGIVQGITISGLLIFHKKYDISTAKYMIMLILACVSVNVFELIYKYGILGPDTPFWILPIGFFPLIIPATYFILKYYVTLESKVKSWEYGLYIPFCFAMFHELSTGIKYMAGNLSTKELKLYSSIDDYIMLNLEFINGVVCFIIFSYFLFRIKMNTQDIYAKFPKFTAKSLAFISISLLVGSVLVLTSAFIAITDYSKEATAIFPHNRSGLELGITALISWFTYGIILHPEIFMDPKKYLNKPNEQKEEQKEEQEEEQEEGTIQTAAIELSDRTDVYHDRILNFMKVKAPYRNPDFSLECLSQEMNLSKSYLSKIINTKEGKNFFDFVNYYRIEEVKQKLMDESFDHFSIIAIALEAGFKSKSTFNTAFKKMTGLPPSKFKEKMKL